MGFSGDIATQFLSNGFLNAKQPIISKCNNTTVLNYFNALFILFDEEPYGYQRLASGICIQLMAELHNIKSGGNNIENLNTMVSRAKSIMYKNITSSIDLTKIA